jgi:glutamate dehydrogenase
MHELSITIASAPPRLVIGSSEKLHLSTIMPVLENLGLSYESEALKSGERHYTLLEADSTLLDKNSEAIAACAKAALQGQMRNTAMNALAYRAGLSPFAISTLRALATYENQLLEQVGQNTIHETLAKHGEFCALAHRYLQARFCPKNHGVKKAASLSESIESYVQQVADLTEDLVLRLFWAILQALLRTNLYKPAEGAFFDAQALSFKIDTTRLSDFAAGIQPRIEAFVYHPMMNGVHHRRTPISRGGIRHSERTEDYRQEVRSLMQAQRVKNAVIVPSGAKGGFVIHQKPLTREGFEQFYSLYMEALLDLVDNREEGAITTPKWVVRYDRDDPYFVVAADKGTARMSDTANAISLKRGFWLGDAFASGGKSGFSHKGMGITAKGAIKSVERFFIERGINPKEHPVSVVGIGSPAGDVFGNGMLLSDHYKLLGAIGSREIFIDPDPDPQVATAERKRLFEAGLGWREYNAKLISAGGGIFDKGAKKIEITPQIKALLGTTRSSLSGPELARMLLAAPCDMLFSAGVGTYIKSESESERTLGDKSTEGLRINANQVRALSICEGGNLGLTQKARLEYAANGGFIATDSIDNSAGVHTSDYEVNIKIILDSLVKKGALDSSRRQELLEAQQPEVEKLVLLNNYTQSLALSLDQRRDPGPVLEAIRVLEGKLESFDRIALDIPRQNELRRLAGENRPLPRPLLAVLLGYAKILVKSRLIASGDFLDEPLATRWVERYFPKAFTALYKQEVLSHPLRHEIIATQMASFLINTQGAGFIADLAHMSESDFLIKIQSTLAVGELFGASDLRFSLYRQDFRMSAQAQYTLLLSLEEAIGFGASWIVRHQAHRHGVLENPRAYREQLDRFLENLPLTLPQGPLSSEERTARFFGQLGLARFAPLLLIVHERRHLPFDTLLDTLTRLDEALGLRTLLEALRAAKVANEWQQGLLPLAERTLHATAIHLCEAALEHIRSDETPKEATDRFIQSLPAYTKEQPGDRPFEALILAVWQLQEMVDAAG